MRLLAVTLFSAGAACADRAGTPVEPPALQRDSGLAPAFASAAGVDICHVDNGKNGYKLLTVKPSAVPGHLAHGDAVPGGILGGDCRFTAFFLDPRTTYDTQLWGGMGGWEYVDDCPAGSVGVGYTGTVALWFNWATVAQLQMQCRPLLPNGTLDSTMSLTPVRGGGGAATLLIPFSGSCPEGQVLVGGSGTHGQWLATIGGSCATIPRVASGLGGLDARFGPFVGPGDPGSNTSFDRLCRAGSLMTGMTVRSGDVIDAMGFRCTTLRMPAQNAAGNGPVKD